MLSFTNFTYRKRSIIIFSTIKKGAGFIRRVGVLFLEIFILNLVGFYSRGEFFREGVIRIERSFILFIWQKCTLEV